MRAILLLIWGLGLGATPARAADGWFDRSHEIFFPADLRENIGIQQTFPLFWWNFLVIESSRAPEGLCQKLRDESRAWSVRLECGQNLGDLRPLITDWTRDLPLREPMPAGGEIREKLAQAMSKATLPSTDAELLNVLRTDPLESWHELRRHAERRLRIRLERKDGLFHDPASGRIVVPILMGNAPSESHVTAELRKGITRACKGTCDRWWMIGPHASAFENEHQVMNDVETVSWVGTWVVVLFAAFFALTGRWRATLLFPAVLIGVGAGAAVTILAFGSIHGLSLAFGAGIVGLALDYGLHAALDREARGVWRSNLFGLLSTLTGLMILMTSSIPLLRQLAFFSVVGLLFAYAILYILFQVRPQAFETRPLSIDFKPKAWSSALACGLILAALWGLATLRPNLDLRQMDFQDPGTRSVAQWLFKSMGFRAPLFTTHADAELEKRASEEAEWARASGIELENLRTYLPDPASREKARATWDLSRVALSAQERKFFAPFVEGIETPSSSRSYIAHLKGEGRWISLWLPADAEQEARVRAKYPDAASLGDVALAFPRTLARELAWMVPLTIALVLFILFGFFKKPAFALVALIPFVSGLGMVTLAHLVFGAEVSFVSLIGLVMVFGSSIDFGIFVAEAHADSDSGSPHGVWTAVSIAAMTNLAGFAPLVFCAHPVLKQLGQALFFGTIGTFLGAAWGIPGLMAYSSRRRK